MKRVVALGSFLILLWVFSGVAAAQSLSGLTGPLDDAVDTVTSPVDKVNAPVDKVKEVVDKVTKPATEALPAPVKNPVDNVVKDVNKTVDTVVKDVTNAGNQAAAPAKNAPLPGVNSGGNPSNAPGSAQAPGPSTNRSASRATKTETKAKAARTSKASRNSSKGANRSEPARDTDQVAAAGNAIEPGEVKGTHVTAPATDVEDSQGSGLSLTGVQILTWLILACALMGAGAALFQSGRIRLRSARS
jgi:cobalamin biosynthesis Mg chelatase CobN